ncbi:MAG: LLM class flavin-dependent oxidoreductase, partial [Acidiferrobacterales bacterium]
MEFSQFLSCYYPDTSYPPAKLYADMLEQAKLAEELGFVGVTIPEHHFINILMNPAPLLLAVKVASVTSHI